MGADSIRRAAAVVLLVLGSAALWWARSGAQASASANDAMVAAIAAAREHAAANDPRLKAAWRFEEGGWIYVHLEGDPGTIGYQHGYLLAPEIEDGFAAVSAGMMHSTERNWEFFRKAAHEMLWPKIDAEYQQELKGIVEGLRARTGSKLDVDDIVAFNGFEELPDYYVPWLNKQQKAANAPNLKSPGNCSAFVATGSWTKDGQIVMAHNNWTSYRNGERWRIVFDIAPQNGHRILMDGFPGVIASDDDFGINRDGLMVTETTITQYEGWYPNGKAELRKDNKGKIDVALAETMLGDHSDTAQKKEEPNERTLCGHVDGSPRGVKEWEWQPYYPGGAVQGKATDSAMAKEMLFVARMGHPCGGDFLAKPFLAAHPEFAWEEPYLRDMKAGPWTKFRSGQASKE